MEKIVGRFKGKLVKMIADMGADFDDFLFLQKLDRFFCIGLWTNRERLFEKNLGHF